MAKAAARQECKLEIQRVQSDIFHRISAEERLNRPRIHPEDLPLYTPDLEALFRELDKNAMTAASNESVYAFRLGSIAAHRTQLEFYYRLASSPAIRTICEVGFNMGHSTALWLTANPTARVHSFDLLETRPGKAQAAFLRSRFRGRLHIKAGDSLSTIPRARIDPPCDLVHVDGRHNYLNTVTDALNFVRHSTGRTLYLFDDQCDPANCTSTNHVPGEPTLATCDLVSSGLLMPLASFYGSPERPIKRQFALFHLNATEEARALAVRVLVWTSVFGFQPAPRDLFHPEDIASTPPKLHPPSNLSRSTRGRHGLDAPRRAP